MAKLRLVERQARKRRSTSRDPIVDGGEGRDYGWCSHDLGCPRNTLTGSVHSRRSHGDGPIVVRRWPGSTSKLVDVRGGGGEFEGWIFMPRMRETDSCSVYQQEHDSMSELLHQ